MTPRRVILRRVRLRAVSHCPESDSAQYHTAPSRENEMSKNPKLSNTAPSQTIFFWFSKTSISMTFRIYVMILRKKFENILKIQKWLTLRWIRLRSVWYCAESDSAQYDTARSQQLKFIADAKVSNTHTARSFAGNGFVFAGLSFPSMRILNFYKNICVLLQHSPTFFVNIVKG